MISSLSADVQMRDIVLCREQEEKEVQLLIPEDVALAHREKQEKVIRAETWSVVCMKLMKNKFCFKVEPEHQYDKSLY